MKRHLTPKFGDGNTSPGAVMIIRKKWWIFCIPLVMLTLCYVGWVLRRTHISKEFITQHLRKGMTVAQVEKACGLSPGTLHLELSDTGSFHAQLVEGESLLSLATPQDHITLFFDKGQRLEGAWYESVYRADEVVEYAISLAEK